MSADEKRPPRSGDYGQPTAPPRNQESESPTAAWSIKHHLRQEAIKKGQKIAQAIARKAAKGDMRAANMMIEHLEGKAHQTVNMGVKAGMISPQQAIPASDAEAAYRRMLDGE